ncbi:MAG TPA: hypothetical protein VFU31_22685 [Candidatus Binatia bacterium]|nr:hypothetical protein [Candidatus Binatia bacterium]
MKKSTTPAPMSAEGLKHAMEQNQLPATATEQAIGGRKANPTPKPNPEAAENPEPTPAAKPKKVKKSAMKPIVEKIFVRHDFADGEFAEMGKKLGIHQRELLEIEAQLKSIKSDFKARTDKVVTEINRLSNCVNDGYVMREVESLVLVAINPSDKTAQKCYYERTAGKFIKAEPFAVDGQLDMFALHPKPKDIKKKLSDKILRSAV